MDPVREEVNRMTEELDAENAVAGSILIEPGSYRRVASLVKAEYFRSSTARAIFEAAASLDRRGGAIDVITVQAEAKKAGKNLDNATLVGLMHLTPTACNDLAYAEIVRDHALRRSLGDLCQAAESDRCTPVPALLADTAEKISLISRGMADTRVSDASTAVAECYRQLADRDPSRLPVSSGYPALDKLLGGGFLKGGMYVIAGRPGMGKTAFALNLAERMAQKGQVLFISLEMTRFQLVSRLLAMKCRLPVSRLMNCDLSPEELSAMTGPCGLLAEEGLHFGSGRLTTGDILAQARSVSALTAVFIDYMGLVEMPGKANLYEKMTAVSGSVKQMALTLDVPVIALAQLNRQNEQRSDKSPQLSDLRDSGAIEQDADGVLLLYRSDYYEEPVPGDAPALCVCHLAKNRHAGTGKVYFSAFLPICRFAEAARDKGGGP